MDNKGDKIEGNLKNTPIQSNINQNKLQNLQTQQFSNEFLQKNSNLNTNLVQNYQTQQKNIDYSFSQVQNQSQNLPQMNSNVNQTQIKQTQQTNIPQQNINNKQQFIGYNLNLATMYYNEGLRLKDQFSFSDALVKFEETQKIFINILPLVDDSNLKQRIEYYQGAIRDLIEHCNNQIANQFTYKKTACYGYQPKKEEKVDYLECFRDKKSTTVQIVKSPQKEGENLQSKQSTGQKSVSHHSEADIEKEKRREKLETSVPEDLRNRILNEILDTKPCVSFNDVIGLSQAKQILKEIIVLPSLRPDLFTGLRAPPRGLLLFGPPGTGKTMIAKAVATECKCTFFNISASSLTSKYLGESEKLVRGLFCLAFEKQPSVIFLDEIDSILSKRSDNENDAVKRLKTEFLVQFDGVGSDQTAKVLVIGATNRPFELDNAVLRRLPKRIHIRQFNCEERVLFVKEIMNNAEHKISDQEFSTIGELTENYSNSDLKELCREAAYEPIREISTNITSVDKLRPVIVEDFGKAAKNVRGTLTKEVLKELENWNNSFGAI